MSGKQNRSSGNRWFLQSQQAIYLLWKPKTILLVFVKGKAVITEISVQEQLVMIVESID